MLAKTMKVWSGSPGFPCHIPKRLGSHWVEVDHDLIYSTSFSFPFSLPPCVFYSLIPLPCLFDALFPFFILLYSPFLSYFPYLPFFTNFLFLFPVLSCSHSVSSISRLLLPSFGHSLFFFSPRFSPSLYPSLPSPYPFPQHEVTVRGGMRNGKRVEGEGKRVKGRDCTSFL